MAVYNLENYLEKDGLGFPLNFRRGNPNPLDNSSVQPSLDAAKNYAKTDATAYVGQILSVINKADDGSLSVDVYKIVNESGDLEKVGSSEVGATTDGGGEIFNDYTNNVASGEFSHAEGKASVARTDYSHAQGNACIAGGRGFKVVSKPFTDSASGKSIIELASVVGLAEGDKYSMKFGNNFIDFGDILEIYPESNSVVVDKIPTYGMTGSTGVFWIGRKQLGTDLTKVAFRNKDYDIREIEADANDFDAQVDALEAEGYTLLGCGTILLDSCQHAEGTDSIAVGYAAHAEGNESIASGRWSHAEGNGTYAGYAAHSEGNSTKATGEHAHAEGGYTEATGGNAHAEGFKTKATGAQAHAAGKETTASGENSYAGGRYSAATQLDSFAHGDSAKAQGKYSVAMGRNTEATKEDSVAFGLNVKAESDTQIAVGRNNAADSDAQFIVGIGTAINLRKNGLVVKKDGDVLAGKATTDNADNLTLTTKGYVDAQLSQRDTRLNAAFESINEHELHFDSIYSRMSDFESSIENDIDAVKNQSNAALILAQEVQKTADTANTTANNARDTAGDAKSTAQDAISIAKEKSRAIVFDTEQDMYNYIDDHRYKVGEHDISGELPGGWLVYSIDYPGKNVPLETLRCKYTDDSGEHQISVSRLNGRAYACVSVSPGFVLSAEMKNSFYMVNPEGTYNGYPRFAYVPSIVTPESVRMSSIDVGTNFYIVDTEVPDYWFDGSTAQELETKQVDLTNYVSRFTYEGLVNRVDTLESTVQELTNALEKLLNSLSGGNQ